jgi:hypothetical protein
VPSGDMAREETLSRWAMKVLIQSPGISGGGGGGGEGGYLFVYQKDEHVCLRSPR